MLGSPEPWVLRSVKVLITVVLASAALAPAPAIAQSVIHATRVTSAIHVDGRLDEAVYESVTPISNFIQQEPHEGEPATERTDVWVFFDRDNVYVSARCWETHPERMIANELQRDNLTVLQNDNFGFLLDTFDDHRNGVLFQTTPLGTRVEGQVTNERDYNGDWNPVWDLAVGRFPGGWTVEAAIPFKSLRYRPGANQVWGFIARRISKWKNEISYNVPIPASRGISGALSASLAATLDGIEAPKGSKNIEIKPFATSSLTSDLRAVPVVSNDPSAAWGADVKYGLTQNLTSNFTYNTDFAQVEADQQQINLTRFNLFFPEKRDFFLENQGLFGFGGASSNGASDVPVLFYSRQIGLSQGRAVPILGGGRLTGRVGRFSVGAVDIASRKDAPSASPATNFSVLRLKRDILNRSSLGLLYTRRSATPGEAGSNEAYGVDGAINLFTNLSINTYWARTSGVPLSGSVAAGASRVSYRGQIDYEGDRYGLQLDRLVVGDGFSPGVGFVRRNDMRKTYAQVRFSPRPAHSALIRKLYWIASAAYISDHAGRVETRDLYGEFAVDFQNSDHFTAQYEREYEFVPAPFNIASGVTLPVAGYEFGTARAGYNFGGQRRLAGNLLAEYGTFYDGHRTAFTVSQGRATLTPRISIEPTYSINRVTLAEGAFTTHLAGARVTYTTTPLMFTSALIQYNSSTHNISANVRLRWEYRPGSELFVVYNESRDTLSAGFPQLANRSLIFKINRLVRF